MADTELLQQRRPEHRWPWLVSGVLYVAAGAAAWWATQLSWAACTGANTLWSSILVSHLDTVEWSEACYIQMDSGGILQSPDAPAATAAAVSALFVAAAWLVLVVALRWTLHTRVLAAGLGLATLSLGLALPAPSLASTAAFRDGLMLGIDIVALLALIAVIVRWRHEQRTLLRVAVAWSAAASFGAVSMILDYLAMVALSDADWDTPPGSGYLPALWMATSGAIMIALTLVRAPDLVPASAPEQVEQVDAVA